MQQVAERFHSNLMKWHW